MQRLYGETEYYLRRELERITSMQIPLPLFIFVKHWSHVFCES